MVKRFFRIETPYQFEMNDIRAIIQIINVALIMIFGLIKDFTTDRHINSIAMHTAGAVLNIYFLTLLYK